MKETRNPKPAEDVAGDTANANRRTSSEGERPADMNSSEGFAGEETHPINESTGVADSPPRDAVDVEQGARSKESDVADLV